MKERDYDFIELPEQENYKPLSENEGRIGYFRFCEDNEEKNVEPIIVSEYESNHRPVRLPC